MSRYIALLCGVSFGGNTGNQLLTNCQQLKMQSTDGKFNKTYAANTNS